MIISVRGTSGAGKSYLVRAVTAAWATDGSVEIMYPAPRKRKPAGQIFRRGDRRLFVPGHYEIANGGIDTLPSLQYAYEMIYHHHEIGCDVLYEGKNMSDSTPPLIRLRDEYDWDARVVLLATGLEQCVEGVRKRGHKIAETSIAKTYRKCEKDFERFKAAGLICLKADREQAAQEILKWLTTSAKVTSFLSKMART